MALKGVEYTQGPFEELSASLEADQLEAWSKDAEKAGNERGNALNIYNLKMEKGVKFIYNIQSWFWYIILDGDITPSMIDMRFNLLEDEEALLVNEGFVSWLVEGISIEDAQ